MYRFKVGKEREGDCIGFDLDGTLITTKSGNNFPKDWEDWKFLPGVIDKLRNMKEGILIVTNQNGKNFSIEDFKKKILAIGEEMKIGFRIYIATKKDRYRKPCVGFFDDATPKKIISFVGDAAGRSAGKKKDHSDTDYKFALNLGIPFFTPEEFFLGKEERKKTITYPEFPIVKELYKPSAKLVILIGYPGAGKSWYSKQFEYERINQDILKKKEKCVSECERLMKENKKIIIDNTNPSQEVRDEYIQKAKKYKYSYEIIHIDTPKEICEHNMMMRCCEEKKEFVSSIAYNVFKGKFSKEGITKTIQLPHEWNGKYYF